jgi:hypothetical protein
VDGAVVVAVDWSVVVAVDWSVVVSVPDVVADPVGVAELELPPEPA